MALRAATHTGVCPAWVGPNRTATSLGRTGSLDSKRSLTPARRPLTATPLVSQGGINLFPIERPTVIPLSVLDIGQFKNCDKVIVTVGVVPNPNQEIDGDVSAHSVIGIGPDLSQETSGVIINGHIVSGSFRFIDETSVIKSNSDKGNPLFLGYKELVLTDLVTTIELDVSLKQKLNDMIARSGATGVTLLVEGHSGDSVKVLFHEVSMSELEQASQYLDIKKVLIKKRYPNDDVYQEEWIDGKRQGTLTYNNGDVYDGKYQDGKANGQGTYRYNNGDVYKGRFQDGKRQGQGTLTYNNGDVYKGTWEDGKRHGQGTLTYVSGDVYQGEWNDGNPHGQGTYRNKNGDVYKGRFDHGRPSGPGEMTIKGDYSELSWLLMSSFREIVGTVSVAVLLRLCLG